MFLCAVVLSFAINNILVKQILMEIYNDPSNAGAFGGVKRFAVSANIKDYDRAKELLSTSDAYTLHKPAVRKFKRRKYIVSGIDALWQADLGDFSSLSRQNKGFKYVLFVIDVFSKVLWVEPVKNKRAKTVDEAFNIILSRASPRKPRNVMTDKGTEFSSIRKTLSERGIKYYTAENAETKASVAERVIRTIKGKIYRYFTYTGKPRYVDRLHDFVQAYNNSKHRSIGMKPNEVCEGNTDKVFTKLYPNHSSDIENNPKFNTGDKVRISIDKPTFSKGYSANWTTEIFTVSRRHTTVPPVYEIVDKNQETIKGTFYEQEMQKVT